MSVPEAESKGIDVDDLEKTDAPSDPASPFGTQSSSSGAAALEEKIQDLKMSDASETSGMPNGEATRCGPSLAPCAFD